MIAEKNYGKPMVVRYFKCSNAKIFHVKIFEIRALLVEALQLHPPRQFLFDEVRWSNVFIKVDPNVFKHARHIMNDKTETILKIRKHILSICKFSLEQRLNVKDSSKGNRNTTITHLSCKENKYFKLARKCIAVFPCRTS